MEGPPQAFVAHVNEAKDLEGWQEVGQVLPFADAEPRRPDRCLLNTAGLYL